MSIISSMMTSEQDSYDNNIKKLGYADFKKPASISIYPKNFESKEKVIHFLDTYNHKIIFITTKAHCFCKSMTIK